jgi:hypothetical protein
MSARELERRKGRTAGIAKEGGNEHKMKPKKGVRGLELKQKRERERDKMTAAKRKG